MSLPICLLGFRAIHEIPLDYYQALTASGYKKLRMSVCNEQWGIKKALTELWPRGRGLLGSSFHLNKVGLEFSKFYLSEAACMI